MIQCLHHFLKDWLSSNIIKYSRIMFTGIICAIYTSNMKAILVSQKLHKAPFDGIYGLIQRFRNFFQDKFTGLANAIASKRYTLITENLHDYRFELINESTLLEFQHLKAALQVRDQEIQEIFQLKLASDQSTTNS